MKLSTLLEADDPAQQLKSYALQLQSYLVELPSVDLDVEFKLDKPWQSLIKGKSMTISFKDEHDLVTGSFSIGYTLHDDTVRWGAASIHYGDMRCGGQSLDIYKVMEVLTGGSKILFISFGTQLKDSFPSATIVKLDVEPGELSYKIFAPFMLDDIAVTPDMVDDGFYCSLVDGMVQLEIRKSKHKVKAPSFEQAIKALAKSLKAK